MLSTVRKRFLSFARRLAIATDYSYIAHISVRRKNVGCWRTLNYNVRMVHSVIQSTHTWATSKDESREMMAAWPDVVRDLTDAVKSLNIPDVTKWMAKVLEYNVRAGKKTIALESIYAYKLLIPSDQLTEENIRLVRILAWCVELMIVYLLMLDDIEDRSLLRRGQPCWYRYNDTGLVAINDAIMLQSAMFSIMRKHFKGKDCYVNLLETFQDITMKLTIGQCLDLLSSNFGKKPNLDLFTTNRYNFIVKYKTAYMFTLPVIAAMHLVGIKDPEMFRQAKTILLEIGHLAQVQDDYLDCFRNSSEFYSEDGTDIQEGKCTWLIVTALQRVTPEQRKILEECYGVSDPEKIRRVKQLFTSLNLRDTYSTYAEETYNLINTHIQQISCGLPHKIFLDLLGKIYHGRFIQYI